MPSGNSAFGVNNSLLTSLGGWSRKAGSSLRSAQITSFLLVGCVASGSTIAKLLRWAPNCPET